MESKLSITNDGGYSVNFDKNILSMIPTTVNTTKNYMHTEPDNTLTHSKEYNMKDSRPQL